MSSTFLALRWLVSDPVVIIGATAMAILSLWLLVVELTTHGKLIQQVGVFSAIGSPLLGFLAALLAVALVRQERKTAGRDAAGHLNVAPALAALKACQPDRFDTREVRRRRRVNSEIEKLAAAIEGIPTALRLRREPVTRAAAARGAGMRALQVRIARMTEADKERLATELTNAKELYDSGHWIDLQTAEIHCPAKQSLLARAFWVCTALMCVAAILAVFTLTALAVVPAGVATSVPFVLGLVLCLALGRLGISAETMKQAVYVSAMTQGASASSSNGNRQSEPEPKVS